MRRKITLKGKLPGAKPPVACDRCQDTGLYDHRIIHTDGNFRTERRTCSRKGCAAGQRVRSERTSAEINNRAQRLRNTPCTECANRGYMEWGDGTRTPCSKKCTSVAVAIAMGLIEPL